MTLRKSFFFFSHTFTWLNKDTVWSKICININLLFLVSYFGGREVSSEVRYEVRNRQVRRIHVILPRKLTRPKGFFPFVSLICCIFLFSHLLGFHMKNKYINFAKQGYLWFLVKTLLWLRRPRPCLVWLDWLPENQQEKQGKFFLKSCCSISPCRSCCSTTSSHSSSS